MQNPPELSVVVPTHARPIRLLWLLNALEEQTLPRERWELLVAHDEADDRTRRLLDEHPLTAAGVLRPLPSASPVHGVKRNAAWRAARAPVIVFTDDDCRPPEDWLENFHDAIAANPGAIVQGATHPDPDEFDPHAAPLFTTQMIDPPTKWGQTCNIAYPREVLEANGGFDEAFAVVGEDCDLLQRALSNGARQVGAPEAQSFHAVEARSLRMYLRRCWSWQDVPGLVARHPHLRDGQPLGGWFWKPAHAAMLLAAPGVLLAAVRRRPAALLLALPWARVAFPWHGHHLRGRIRSTLELPRRFVVDLVETIATIKGSIKHRTFFV